MKHSRLPALCFLRLPALLPLLIFSIILGGCAMAPVADLSSVPPGRVFRDCTDCPEMAAIPPGRFMMGTPASDSESWSLEREGPVHEVAIARAFALGRYEVTRAQFATFAAATRHASNGCFKWTNDGWVNDQALDWRNPGFAQRDDEPVVCVSWSDAHAYVNWLSARTGLAYRLPSESEWEYAARAGTTTTRFWGNGIDEGCRYANMGDLTMNRELGITPFADCDDGYARTAPVGRFLPNAFGLFDMLGNAWEWTADCWHEGYIGAPVDGSAWTGGDCMQRVNRGAGWNSHVRNMRSSNRGSYAPVPYETVGFRVAR